MSEYILANIDFDKKKNTPSHMAQGLNLQLSALSFLLGIAADRALIDFTPSQNYLLHLQKLHFPTQEFCLFQDLPPKSIINPWRITKAITEFAISKQCSLKRPFHPLGETLDSKAYTLSLCPLLFDHCLVFNKNDVLQHLRDKTGVYVLKTPLAQSGQGHFFIEATNLTLRDLPDIDYTSVRLEKWVERVFDFSSQWLLDEKPRLLGVCEMINNDKGGYKGSIYPVQETAYQPFIEAHVKLMQSLLQPIYDTGFRGHLGIDAFVYKESGALQLCPLIEINPRKTMGYVALKLALHKGKALQIELGVPKADNYLLPTAIEHAGARYNFKRNLTFLYL